MSQPNTNPAPGIHVALDELLALSAQARGTALAEVRRSAAARTGLHASRWRGRGVDFRESRIYQPGDDIRHMDWRVTARSGRAHTKLFEEEREHGLLLMVDQNPGMRFGTRVRFKSVQAARAASLLAWMATASGDRVGAIGFGGGIHGEVKPASGRRGVLQVLRSLRDWDQAARAEHESLASGLERARRLLRPGMRLILISDGFSADQAAWATLARCAGRHELGCILVTDALEQAPPPPGRYALSAGGARHMLDFDDRQLRSEWPRHFALVRERVRSEFTRLGARVVELATDADLRRSLAPFTARMQGPKDSSA
ncbi:MAG TPA: DUF58 domain-containing protein [Dokdonella sp.]|uniref:DUF58 domain-containing protein n=1 Tax=Dokdonella sp. TaxID=2291710 RepID=UPI002C9E8427|nr:DUF58 domain-containing protein [Dokdonella sp.]HOX70483.1 DUF58 domain-containing protein [Dokdonella sp.]HPG95090.1 DUF58 domain-containing protein [Dokdonella sp.]HPN79780.1 DUF58 domain-containing protein [Dokdonella sp.]